MKKVLAKSALMLAIAASLVLVVAFVLSPAKFLQRESDRKRTVSAMMLEFRSAEAKARVANVSGNSPNENRKTHQLIASNIRTTGDSVVDEVFLSELGSIVIINYDQHVAIAFNKAVTPSAAWSCVVFQGSDQVSGVCR